MAPGSLVAMGLGIFVIANDLTALSVAIPDIEQDLGSALTSALTSAQWVINGYALVFGVLIVPGGSLADLYGRKPLFMIGATIFAGFPLLSGLMPTVELLTAGGPRSLPARCTTGSVPASWLRQAPSPSRWACSYCRSSTRSRRTRRSGPGSSSSASASVSSTRLSRPWP